MEAFAATVAGGLFPRLASHARWPMRLRGRRLLLYVVWNTAVIFALRFVLLPRLRDQAAIFEHAASELTAELGREPRWEEVGERMGLKSP
jgi:hypothetical protein